MKKILLMILCASILLTGWNKPVTEEDQEAIDTILISSKDGY